MAICCKGQGKLCPTSLGSIMLQLSPATSPSAHHNERCLTLISALESRGVEPGITQAFRKLVKSNSVLRALLRTEQMTNIALRGMLESRAIGVSDYVIDTEPSFEFISQASRADSTGEGQGAISAPKCV